VGDFAILLDNGYAPRAAFVFNTLSACATLPGAILGFLWLPAVSQFIPYVLALSAASFIYIALADLIPTLHKRAGSTAAAAQFALLLAGVATIALLQGRH
jgi:zinc and cadmium transporter